MYFEYRTKVYGYDCDIYGHLNNANYQKVYEAARANMLEEIGLPLDKLLSEGIHIYVKRINIDYIKGVKFGSEITVRSYIARLSRVKSVWHQEIYSDRGGVMNKAIIEGVFAKEGKPFRIPMEMFEQLREVLE